jgi:hypothetical protein
VLIELGYAIKSLGWSRIILVMNTAVGGPELLPFDLKTKRVTTYEMAAENPERAPEPPTRTSGPNARLSMRWIVGASHRQAIL